MTRERFTRLNKVMLHVALSFAFAAPDLPADDIVQEAWVKLLRTSSPLEECYVAKVTSNVARDWLRYKRKHPEFAMGDDIAEYEVGALDVYALEEQETKVEKIAMLRHVIQGLPKQMRLPVLLHAHGYTYEGIASITGVPIGTVRSRKHHAYKLLRSREEYERLAESA